MYQLSWIDHFAQKDNRDDLFRLRLLPIFKVTCDDDNVDNLFCGIFTGTTFLGSSGIFQAASGDDNVDNVVFCIGHLHLDSIDPWLVFALGERPSKVKSSPNTRTPCFNFLFLYLLFGYQSLAYAGIEFYHQIHPICHLLLCCLRSLIQNQVTHLSGLRNVDTNVEQTELACRGILHKFEHFTS